ncbi:hypothetical protein [Sphingomicrobium astaxanthinifaciens]|uniref:hypothetical protein n=1 Tax=Sphingomicrobium astaxanthinifaciens TaxID=1227949 RepID=UPI001FCB13C8|nr:hypothetical protein [Sphingomicrobium astaxanthinifaciens]MCJ7420654.1 hypothetical protein [Sphingomicrobium astaxanthinifaciens]
MAGDHMLRVESDLRFYQRRAAQERLAAARAVTHAARERHEMLAARFHDRAREMQAQTA